MQVLANKEIGAIMFGWGVDNDHAFQEQVNYTYYLTQIRDRLIWQELDRMCGCDVATAIKIAEMQ